MKTFTVRQLDREPQTVLAACDAEGAVIVRSRTGRTYTLRSNTTPAGIPRKMGRLPDFEARRRAMNMKPIPKAQARLAARMIAGE